MLLGLQDVFSALLCSREEEMKLQLYNISACRALWKAFPITLLPLMHSTRSTVFLQHVWQRTVLNGAVLRLLSLEGERGFLWCLHMPPPLLPAGLLAPCSLTSSLSSLFCVQGFVSTIWFTSWVRSLEEDENYYIPLTVMWLYIFSVTK